MDIAVFDALVNSANSESIAEAEARGSTPGAETDELERLTGSRTYANVFRALYGVPISDEEQGIIKALREPGKREKLLAVKAGKDE